MKTKKKNRAYSVPERGLKTKEERRKKFFNKEKKQNSPLEKNSKCRYEKEI
jgi:hypothetical protein